MHEAERKESVPYSTPEQLLKEFHTRYNDTFVETTNALVALGERGKRTKEQEKQWEAIIRQEKKLDEKLKQELLDTMISIFARIDHHKWRLVRKESIFRDYVQDFGPYRMQLARRTLPPERNLITRKFSQQELWQISVESPQDLKHFKFPSSVLLTFDTHSGRGMVEHVNAKRALDSQEQFLLSNAIRKFKETQGD